MSQENVLPVLHGKVAIVTGASSGLGRAVSLALGRQGVRLVASARRAERLEELKQAVEAEGGTCFTVVGDAANPETADKAVEHALQRYGQLDILVNNAGQGMYKTLSDSTLVDYERLMRSNMQSSFLFTKAASSHMVKQGSGVLIFISSVAGLAGAAKETIYSASKFAQIGFAQAVDEELRPHGIKVCTLCPGGMKTEFAVGQGRVAADVARSWMMDPAEVAQSVLFACMQPPNVRIPQVVIRHMGRAPQAI